MEIPAKTLCFLVTDSTIWLAMKMVRFGAGKWNGYGGSPDASETIRQATVREIWEESGGEDDPTMGVKVDPADLDKVAIIDFFFGPNPKFRVHVFLARKWQGVPAPTKEMAKPTKFSRHQIPYQEMWVGDKSWMPLVLEQSKKITGSLRFSEDGIKVEHFEYQEYDVIPE